MYNIAKQTLDHYPTEKSLIYRIRKTHGFLPVNQTITITFVSNTKSGLIRLFICQFP